MTTQQPLVESINPPTKDQAVPKEASFSSLQPSEYSTICVWEYFLWPVTLFLVITMIMATKITTDKSNPNMHLPAFLVTSAHLPIFYLNGTQLTARWNISFSVDNGGGMTSISYDMLCGAIFYKNRVLAVGLVVPFYQKQKDVSDLSVSLAAESWSLGDDLTGQFQESLRDGTMEFILQLWARVRFDGRPEPTGITVTCYRMKVVWSQDVGFSVGDLLEPTPCKSYHEFAFPVTFPSLSRL